MELVYINPKDVKLCDNIKKNDKTIILLTLSLRDFDFVSPVTITKNNEIIKGAATVKAALQLKLDKIPAIVNESLNEEQIKAYRILDNYIAEQSAWDYHKRAKEIKSTNFDFKKYGLTENFYSDVNIDEFFEENVSGQIDLFNFV